MASTNFSKLNLGVNPNFFASNVIVRKSLPLAGTGMEKGIDKKKEMFISFPKRLCKSFGQRPLNTRACLLPNDGHMEYSKLSSEEKIFPSL